ncbi:Holliday junction branch migration protein RuvA [Anaplasma bovis]|uniref:Holliday junction branch migration protein RuvA n=1 Tax=Anaplasma bovis TaxID=186733 RepID=UPI002FF2BEB6
MIGSLTGTIGEMLENSQILLEVGGVGYVVRIPYRVLQNCKRNDQIRLYIETYVTRENIAQLYGFQSQEEQTCMRLLVKVNGINYKTASLILDKLTAPQVYTAIVDGDKRALKVGGVGEKLISRIVAELAPQVQKMKFDTVKSKSPEEVSDAMSALISLGYDKMRVLSALKKVGTSHPTSETLRLALKELSQ